jgi:predicted O-methyltransferase YrrM
MNREDFLKKLKAHGKANDIPNISLENAIFLKKLIRDNNTKHLLEIGSAN